MPRTDLTERIPHSGSAWLGSLILARENDGTTTFTGPVTDQTALQGLLAKISDLGILLISE